MAGRLDFLADALPGRISWRFKVRVVRLWEVPAYLRPDVINSVEMVLVDAKGSRIHATVRKQLVYLFQRKLEEGLVYTLSFFTVVPSSGAYRSTPHAYKLLFQMKTRVDLCEGPDISRYAFSLSTIAQLRECPPEYDYLVDTIGLVTGLSSEREYLRDSRVTKMVVVELTDHTGKIEVALFGDYVPQFQKMMSEASGALPICIIQYAKLKLFRDQVSIQNVLNATRILMDPDVAEVLVFKNGLAVHGVETVGSIAVLGPRIRVSMEEDFLHTYVPKKISDLNSVVDNGTFVVSATIIGVVPGEDWWYPACKCHKSVTADSGSYYCDRCVKHVFQMIPRFRVKFVVTDGTGDAVFVVFDNDVQTLVGQRCASLVAIAGIERGGNYPPEILALEGTKVLFKVSRVASPVLMTDCTFRVKRVCTDPDILKSYGVAGDVLGVSKNVGKAVLVGEENLSEGIPSLSEAGIDDFVSSLLVSPGQSSADQSGLSGPVSDDKTPERSSAASVVRLDDDDVGDSTPISVLYPHLASGSPSCAKRSLAATFEGDGGAKGVSPTKSPKLDGLSDIEIITSRWASGLVDVDSDSGAFCTVVSKVGDVDGVKVVPPVIASDLDDVGYVDVVASD